MNQKTIKHWSGKTYTCHQEWPSDCYLQFGPNGIVFPKETFQEQLDNPKNAIAALLGISDLPEGSYRTAFFEAFPRNPDRFIRGEGETVEAAEAQAWDIYTSTAHQ